MEIEAGVSVTHASVGHVLQSIRQRPAIAEMYAQTEMTGELKGNAEINAIETVATENGGRATNHQIHWDAPTIQNQDRPQRTYKAFVFLGQPPEHSR